MDIEKRLRGAFRRVTSECLPNYEYYDDMEDVKKCIEKQIPLQPHKLIGCDIFECSMCNHPIKRYHNYCQSCGQRIEWDKDKWKK